MHESFASFWLSRAALVALVVYLFSAYRLWRLSPKATPNRLAALLCLDLAAWALQAALSYAADDPAVTVALSRALSWSWPFFPAIGLNFAIEISDTSHRLTGAKKTALIAAIYASALLFYYLLSWPMLRGAIRRAGYWSVDVGNGAGFAVFSVYYVGLNLVGMFLVARTWFHSKERRERMRLGIFVGSHAAALLGGFTTDTALALLGIDFPKVGVLWALIWAAGLIVAMERYGFMAPFSAKDTGLLMDRFVERSMDGIVVSDSSGRVIYWNAPLAALTGISLEEAQGASILHIQELLSPPGSPKDSIARTVMDSIRVPTEGSPRLVELMIVDRLDRAHWVQTSVFSIPSVDGDIWAFIVRDVTREKQAAAEAIERMRRQSHAQKMEALGSLAGGIAHDFNNTLAGIVGAVSLIRACMDDDDGSKPIDFSKELDVIYRSAQRASSSVRGLMAFTVMSPQKSERFRLDESLARVAIFAGRTLDRSVKVTLADAPAEAWVVGDAPQIEQLILNLVINAEHSMTIMRPIGAAKGGVMRLSIRLAESGSKPAADHPDACPGPYWVMSISDEGVGIDQKTLSCVFDPFFTTKAADQGSGLGLAMVHLIAKQHRGFVEVESTLGAGSTFSVYLPAACGESVPQ